MGVDLSLGSSGLVLLPEGWVGPKGLDWSGVEWMVTGEDLETTAPESERVQRLRRLSWNIAEAARAWGATHAVFEQHAFRQGTHHAYSRGELAGAVKLRLAARGIWIESYHASSARKTLLGRCPRTGAKAAALAYCKGLGLPWAKVRVGEGYEDLCDAFVVANHTMSLLGSGFVGSEAA